MTRNGKHTRKDIYVVANLKEPLLGKPAIAAPNLIQKVASIQYDLSFNDIKAEAKANHPRQFKGLGEFKGEFKIKLKPDSTPYTLTTPRRVALPLMSKVKTELERMQNLGVVSKVDIPTDWCARMLVVPKPDGKIRLCVDLTKLNGKPIHYPRLKPCWLKSKNPSASPNQTAIRDFGKRNWTQTLVCLPHLSHPSEDFV